jgi:transcription termination factor NusB
MKKHISSKVDHIVTDSAANMQRAFITLPGIVDCSEEESDSDRNSEESDSDYTAQAVKEGFENQAQINNLISKCGKIVSCVRKSTIATDILRGEKGLQSFSITRWNS